jgi:non-specific serine/threonine protein kinase
MAMPVLRGQTLKQMRQAASAAPEEAWMRDLLASMLDALERLHGANVYHRDISPDNIQIEPDGRAVLLDFGAARRVAADKSQTLTAILKPAYAPIEQYGEAGSVRQGPWTDFYALGATLHFLLLARPPAPATARMLHDDAPSLVECAPAGYSADWLRLVDWMLAPKPSDRPQSVAALREVLQGRRMAPGRAAGPPGAVPSEDIDRTVLMARPQALAAAPAARAAPARRSTAAWLGGAAVAVLAIVAGGSLWMQPAVAPPAAAMVPATPAEVVAQPGLKPPAAPASETAPAFTAAPADATAARPSAAAASTPPAAAVMARPVELPVPARQSPRADTAAAPLAPARILSPATESRAAGPTAPAGGRQQAATAAPTLPTVPAVTSAPDAAVDPAAQGPEATCSTRPHLRYFACMERMCWRSENRQHPDCLKWRKDVPANN